MKNMYLHIDTKMEYGQTWMNIEDKRVKGKRKTVWKLDSLTSSSR